MKHSGARNVRVAIESRNRHLLVRVTDNGTGFDPKSVQGPTDQGGFGLFSIRERVMAFNGTMTVESNPESGTEVTIALPRDAKESPAGKKRGKSLRGRPPQGRIP
jgi:signal transduction histidine kinase